MKWLLISMIILFSNFAFADYVPVEDLFKNDELHSLALNSAGTHYVSVVNYEGYANIYITSTKIESSKRVARAKISDFEISEITWIDNDSVYVSAKKRRLGTFVNRIIEFSFDGKDHNIERRLAIPDAGKMLHPLTWVDDTFLYLKKPKKNGGKIRIKRMSLGTT